MKVLSNVVGRIMWVTPRMAKDANGVEEHAHTSVGVNIDTVVGPVTITMLINGGAQVEALEAFTNAKAANKWVKLTGRVRTTFKEGKDGHKFTNRDYFPDEQTVFVDAPPVEERTGPSF